jgi:hypothetical protein
LALVAAASLALDPLIPLRHTRATRSQAAGPTSAAAAMIKERHRRSERANVGEVRWKRLILDKRHDEVSFMTRPSRAEVEAKLEAELVRALCRLDGRDIWYPVAKLNICSAICGRKSSSF